MVWKMFDFRFSWFVQVMDGGSAPEGRSDGPIAQKLLEQKLGCRRRSLHAICALVEAAFLCNAFCASEFLQRGWMKITLGELLVRMCLHV